MGKREKALNLLNESARIYKRADETLADLKAPERTRIAMVTRGPEHFVPTAESQIEAEDVDRPVI